MNRTRKLNWRTMICIVPLILLSACEQALFTTPTSTLAVAVEATPAEKILRDFPILDAEHYNECEISPADFGDYAKWVERNAQDLVIAEPDPDKILFTRTEENMFIYTKSGGGELRPAETPFYSGFTFCSTEVDAVEDNGSANRTAFVVAPVVFSVPGKPREKVVILTLIRSFTGWSESQFVELLNHWTKKRALLIVPINMVWRIDPIAAQNEANFPDMEQRLNQFMETLDPTQIKGIMFEALLLN